MTTRSLSIIPQRRAVAYTHRLLNTTDSLPRLRLHQQLRLPSAPSSSSFSPARILPLTSRRDIRHFVTTTTKMASDNEYMTFLHKANEDPSAGYPAAASSGEFKTLDEGAVVPAVISHATKDAFYMSDADEPFVPVVLAWDEAGKGLPDQEEFASLIHHPDPANAEIEIQDPAEWDPQGHYGAILDAVTEAGKGNDVRVYRVEREGARVEYWVITTDGKGAGARLIGAKALSIES